MRLRQSTIRSPRHGVVEKNLLERPSTDRVLSVPGMTCCHGTGVHGESCYAPRLRSRGALRRARLCSSGGHLEVDEITQQVRERIESVSTRACTTLLGPCPGRLGRRIELAGSPAGSSPGRRTTITTSSAAVRDDRGRGLRRRRAAVPGPRHEHGFEVVRRRSSFWGLARLAKISADRRGCLN